MSGTTRKPSSWDLAKHVRNLLKAPGVPFSDAEYAVLEEYCWHWNQTTGTSRPGMGRMAWRINRSERQVQRIVHGLEGVHILKCVSDPKHQKGGRVGEHGITREFVLHILDWPHTKVEWHPDVTVDRELPRHPDVTVDRAVRVTSDASYPDISAPVTLTFEAPYPDIQVSPEQSGTEKENREREQGGHLGTSVAAVPSPSLSRKNTLHPDPDPDPRTESQQDSSAHALAAALGEAGAGSAAPIIASDVEQLAQLGATTEEVRVGWALLVADLAGKPFTPSVKLLAKQWAGDSGWQSKARAEIAKRAKAARAAREAQERADREAAAYERYRLQVEAEEQRRAELTPEEREAEDTARREAERARQAEYRRQKEAQQQRIDANFARAFQER